MNTIDYTIFCCLFFDNYFIRLNLLEIKYLIKLKSFAVPRRRQSLGGQRKNIPLPKEKRYIYEMVLKFRYLLSLFLRGAFCLNNFFFFLVQTEQREFVLIVI